MGDFCQLENLFFEKRMFYQLNKSEGDQEDFKEARKQYKQLGRLTASDLSKTVSLTMLLKKNEKMMGHFQLMPTRLD